MKAAPFIYRRASTLRQAAELAASAGGMNKYIAGGQSLMPMMNLRVATPDSVIDISGIAALRETGRDGDRLFVGAGITHAMIEDGKIDDPALGYLRHVAGGIAYRSVRNKGTIGGSLVHADPAADWPAALLALDAIAVVQTQGGTRKVPLADFQVGLMETSLGQDDILLGISVPILSAGARWSYLKFCHKAGEFAHSIGAVVVDPEQGWAKVVLGAAAGKPRVLRRLSAYIVARDSTTASLEWLVEQDLFDATDFAPDTYAFHLHKTIVTRAVMEVLK
jgi:carbon-monoxide dehydrogenase medium subunit